MLPTTEENQKPAETRRRFRSREEISGDGWQVPHRLFVGDYDAAFN